MNNLSKKKIKITVLITSIKQRKMTLETANYYSQICTEVILVDEQKPYLSALDIIALKKKNITYIPYQAVNSKKIFQSVYQKKLIAAYESSNRYVVHSNHDERYTYFGLLACVSALKKNKKLTFCIGQAIAVKKDASGIYYTRPYKKLNRYYNIKKRVNERLYYHAEMYAPLAHYAVWRRKAYLKTTQMTILVHDKIPIKKLSDEIIFELAADLNGNSKAFPELYWIRNRVNKPFGSNYKEKQNILEITKKKLNKLFRDLDNVRVDIIINKLRYNMSNLSSETFTDKSIFLIKRMIFFIKRLTRTWKNKENIYDICSVLKSNKIRFEKNDLFRALNSMKL
jgi:hypothetical protein